MKDMAANVNVSVSVEVNGQVTDIGTVAVPINGDITDYTSVLAELGPAAVAAQEFVRAKRLHMAAAIFAEPEPETPVLGLDGLKVGDAKTFIDGLTPDMLEVALAEEQAGGNRKGVLRAIQRRL